MLLLSPFRAWKLLYILRCSPCHGHRATTAFDYLLKTGLCYIIHCDLSEIQRLQASMPVNVGGLDVCGVSVLALSAYLASAAATKRTMIRFFLSATACQRKHVEIYKARWLFSNTDASLSPPPIMPQNHVEIYRSECTSDSYTDASQPPLYFQ